MKYNALLVAFAMGFATTALSSPAPVGMSDKMSESNRVPVLHISSDTTDTGLKPNIRFSKKKILDEVDTSQQFDCVCAGGGAFSQGVGGYIGGGMGGPIGAGVGALVGEGFHQGAHFGFDHYSEAMEAYGEANEAHMGATGRQLLTPGMKN